MPMDERGRTRARLVAALCVVLVSAPACFGDLDPVETRDRPPRAGPSPSDRAPGSPPPGGRGGEGGRNCENTSVGLTPLTDLGTGRYKGEAGGLYPGSGNEPPAEHLAAGTRLAESVQPLDAAGRPDPDGRYALLSIGMSNARTEFGALQRFLANRPVGTDPHLVLVNGAQGGKSAEFWIDPAAPVWEEVDRALQADGVTPEQVQVVWLKNADSGPGEWPQYPQGLRDKFERTVQILEDRYPNLRLVYLSSRTFGGYSGDSRRPGEGRNPEPLAYWTGFSVKQLIEDQIEGDPALRFEGAANAPWLGWGPYLWADGVKARSDGLTWECWDFSGGLEIGGPGAMKVAQLLLDFFQTDPTARIWFLQNPA
ncbi:MAG: hypothetical protein ACRDI0_00105 [Actinomycetota bacterium]